MRELIRAYYSGLFRSAYSYLGDEAAAQELVDQVFERFWDKHEELLERPNFNVAGYLFAALRNRALNMLESEKYAEQRRIIMRATDEYPGIAAQQVAPDEAVESSERRDILWSVIETLPERTRAILTMRWQHQMSWQQIAQALEVTEAAVKMAHTRALKLLRDKLPQHFADPGER